MKSKKGTKSVGTWQLLWWPAGLGWPHSHIWLLANHWEGFRGHQAIGLSCTWPSCPSFLPHDHGKFPRGQRPRLGGATLSLPKQATGQPWFPELPWMGNSWYQFLMERITKSNHKEYPVAIFCHLSHGFISKAMAKNTDNMSDSQRMVGASLRDISRRWTTSSGR